MKPKETLWEMDPHTLGKHLVLRYYLDAWFPILGSWNGRILFIDGFAGPGRYTNGEDGSPIIALKSLAEHRAKGIISAEPVFLFVEKEKDRAEYLDGLVNDFRSSLPASNKVAVIHGVFDETLTQVLDQLDAQAKKLAPSFVMIDPFGVSDTPMSIIERILQNPRSEVYVSFMYESLNRFKGTPEFEQHLDTLFGTSEWRQGRDIEEPHERKNFFYDLYEKQLRKAGAKYVVRFELYEGERLVYAIFFGTQSLKGCDEMKKAIWKVAPFGDFAFRSSRLGQLTFGIQTIDFGPLREALKQKFKGKGWVTVEAIEEFVLSDETDFHTGQFKKNALIPMEDSGEIQILDGTRKRKHTYPNGTKIKFV